MATGPLGALAKDLELLAGSGTVAGLTDEELLRRFQARRDGASAELAFGAIVARHGPMVLGVLRHVLREPSDVDDAFQATFLVLVRKAGSVRAVDSLAPWLYGVACRVARKAQSVAWKRARRETPGAVVETEAEAVTPPADDFDLRPVLYEELNRLPEKYRSPVVLCHLEGLTHEEAARRLGWPVGTLSGRLSRARDTLRTRLTRRGLGVPAATLAALLAPKHASAVPPALFHLTVRAASTFAARGTVSATVLTLTRGVLTSMFMNKLKTALFATTAVGLTTAGAGYVAVRGQEPASAQAPPKAQPPAEYTKSAPAVPAAAEATRPAPFTPQPIPGFPKTSERMQAAMAGRNTSVQRTTIPALRGPSIIAVTAPDGRTLNALSYKFEPGAKRVWQGYKIPEGVKHWLPLMGGEVLTIAMNGEVSELAAFSPEREGAWKTQTLREPVEDEVVPIVGPGVAVYQVGNDVYAFSAKASQWGVLNLTGKGAPTVEVDNLAVLVQQGDTLHVFDVANGTWSDGVAGKPIEPKK